MKAACPDAPPGPTPKHCACPKGAREATCHAFRTAPTPAQWPAAPPRTAVAGSTPRVHHPLPLYAGSGEGREEKKRISGQPSRGCVFAAASDCASRQHNAHQVVGKAASWDLGRQAQPLIENMRDLGPMHPQLGGTPLISLAAWSLRLITCEGQHHVQQCDAVHQPLQQRHVRYQVLRDQSVQHLGRVTTTGGGGGSSS